MNSAGSKIILWGLILTMIGFTMSRTLDFLKMTLPPDQQYIAYLALVAFDIGTLGWLYYATNGAEGKQRVVAYGMVFVCAAGVISSTVCDLFIVANRNGLATKPDPQMGTIALWIVCAVIALNFLAGILVHLLDPKHLNHMATEVAKDIIFKSSIEAIKQRAGEIAPRIAISSADYWEAVITQELIGTIPGKKKIALIEIPEEEPVKKKKELPPVVTGELAGSTRAKK